MAKKQTEPVFSALRWYPEPEEIPAQSTIRRQYSEYRRHHDIPARCDNDGCVFHTAPLVWNGAPFTLIVDHVDGARRNNRPKNLRYLCPLCAAQQPTHAGRNKGRVEYSPGGGGYATRRPDGKRDHRLIAEPGIYKLSGPDDPQK